MLNNKNKYHHSLHGPKSGIASWVDEQGNVHYGSQRPQNIEAERLKIQGSQTPYRQPGMNEDEAGEKEKAATEPAQPEAVAPQPEQAPQEPQLSRKEKKRLCQAARQRVATIESRGRLKATDEKGVTRHLTDDERTQRLKQARADVAKYCR